MKRLGIFWLFALLLSIQQWLQESSIVIQEGCKYNSVWIVYVKFCMKILYVILYVCISVCKFAGMNYQRVYLTTAN